MYVPSYLVKSKTREYPFLIKLPKVSLSQELRERIDHLTEHKWVWHFDKDLYLCFANKNDKVQVLLGAKLDI